MQDCQDENYAEQWTEDGTFFSETQSTHQDKENFAEKTAEINFLKDCLKKASDNDRETESERRKQSLKTKLLLLSVILRDAKMTTLCNS